MERLIDVAGIVGIAVAVCNDARVHTRAVAVPDLEECLRHWLTSVHVDYLDVERQRNTLLALGDVLSKQLALYPVGTLCSLRTQDAAVVAREQDRWDGVDCDTSQVGGVVLVQRIFEVAGLKVWLFCMECQCMASLEQASAQCLTSADGPLGSRLLDLCSTTLMHQSVVPALL